MLNLNFLSDLLKHFLLTTFFRFSILVFILMFTLKNYYFIEILGTFFKSVERKLRQKRKQNINFIKNKTFCEKKFLEFALVPISESKKMGPRKRKTDSETRETEIVPESIPAENAPPVKKIRSDGNEEKIKVKVAIMGTKK